VLFRSVATSFSNAACGVLLSGTLDDGVAGLVAIHEAGGEAIAQDPDDAQFPDMPRNAIRTGAVDSVYPSTDIVGGIKRWLARPRPVSAAEATIARDEREVGLPSVFTCPDCGGTLWEVDDEAVLRFRCRTGHAYSQDTMLSAQERTLEMALWAGMRALEERYDLLRRISIRARQSGDSHTTRRIEHQLDDVRRNIERVNGAIAALLKESTNLA
jgi:two-component system chemotaxis response regulator CheB